MKTQIFHKMKYNLKGQFGQHYNYFAFWVHQYNIFSDCIILCLEYANYLATDEESLDDVDCAACIRQNVNHNKDTKQIVTVNRKLYQISVKVISITSIIYVKKIDQVQCNHLIHTYSIFTFLSHRCIHLQKICTHEVNSTSPPRILYNI